MTSSDYFDFIPVDSTRRVPISKRVFTSRGAIKHIDIFEIVFKTEAPLCVGSGQKDLHNNEILLLPLENSTHNAIIPGSSIKGSVASNFLALSGSSERTSNLFGTDRKPRRQSKRHKRDAIGPAISKVFFSDAVPKEPIELEYHEIDESWLPTRRKPRHVKVYTDKKESGKHYGYIKCVPRDCKLKTIITGANLTHFEIGGLLMAIGLVPEDDAQSGIFRLGYAKPQGFGLIRVEKKESRHCRKTIENLLPNETHNAEIVSEFTAKCMKQFIKEGEKTGRKVFEYRKRIFIHNQR